MAQLNQLDEDQLIVYANMLIEKGQTIRREINRKRRRLVEIAQLVPEQAQGAVTAAMTPGFVQIIHDARDRVIDADAVIAAMTPETPPGHGGGPPSTPPGQQ